MKLRVGKKILAYDFEKSKWVRVEILDIDSEGMVRVQDINGNIWESEISEFEDSECFRES